MDDELALIDVCPTIIFCAILIDVQLFAGQIESANNRFREGIYSCSIPQDCAQWNKPKVVRQVYIAEFGVLDFRLKFSKPLRKCHKISALGVIDGMQELRENDRAVWRRRRSDGLSKGFSLRFVNFVFNQTSVDCR